MNRQERCESAVLMATTMIQANTRPLTSSIGINECLARILDNASWKQAAEARDGLVNSRVVDNGKLLDQRHAGRADRACCSTIDACTVHNAKETRMIHAIIVICRIKERPWCRDLIPEPSLNPDTEGTAVSAITTTTRQIPARDFCILCRLPVMIESIVVKL
jgi:hypothetical protein